MRSASGRGIELADVLLAQLLAEHIGKHTNCVVAAGTLRGFHVCHQI